MNRRNFLWTFGLGVAAPGVVTDALRRAVTSLPVIAATDTVPAAVPRMFLSISEVQTIISDLLDRVWEDHLQSETQAFANRIAEFSRN